MKNKLHKILTFFLAGCLTAALLSACGGSSESSSSALPDVLEASESAAADADLSKAGTTSAPVKPSAKQAVIPTTMPTAGSSAESPADSAADSAKLSDDPFSMQASINGIIITVPCKASDFEGTGFTFSDEELNTELEDGYLTTLFAETDNTSNLITAAFRNNSGKAKKLRDITILDVTIESSGDSDISFPGGITFASTMDDVLKLWNGKEPVLSDETVLYYENEDYDTIQYHFDEDGILSKVAISANNE